MKIDVCVFNFAEERKAACLFNRYLVLFHMTIVLCVLYLMEKRKAECLVYWYFV